MGDGLHQWLNRNSAVITMGAVVGLMVVLAYIIFRTDKPHTEVLRQWYYDVTTNTFFAVQGPPIDGFSGKQTENGESSGVRAHIYACGDCIPDLEGQTPEQIASLGMTVPYLEKMDPKVKRQMEQLSKDPSPTMSLPYRIDLLDPMRHNYLVRTLDDPTWHRSESIKGREIIRSSRTTCSDGEDPRPCHPGKI